MSHAHAATGTGPVMHVMNWVDGKALPGVAQCEQCERRVLVSAGSRAVLADGDRQAPHMLLVSESMLTDPGPDEPASRMASIAREYVDLAYGPGAAYKAPEQFSPADRLLWCIAGGSLDFAEQQISEWKDRRRGDGRRG